LGKSPRRIFSSLVHHLFIPTPKLPNSAVYNPFSHTAGKMIEVVAIASKMVSLMTAEGMLGDVRGMGLLVLS
jgi:hypothetical protein